MGQKAKLIACSSKPKISTSICHCLSDLALTYPTDQEGWLDIEYLNNITY